MVDLFPVLAEARMSTPLTRFDDESKSMLELTPEPWPLIAFDGTDSISTDRAFRCLKRALDALVAARRVLDLVPGWEPIRREE